MPSTLAKELTSLGGAAVILATAPDSKAMSALIDGLGVGGQLLVVGASADPIHVTPIQLIGAAGPFEAGHQARPEIPKTR